MSQNIKIAPSWFGESSIINEHRYLCLISKLQMDAMVSIRFTTKIVSYSSTFQNPKHKMAGT